MVYHLVILAVNTTQKVEFLTRGMGNMLNANILKQKLAAIDGQDYAGYQSLLGAYDFNLYKLIIQQIPKDPYAPPHTGIYRIQIQRNDPRIISLKIESGV